MAKFNEMIITTVGKSIYAKAIAGKTIEFTKAVIGDGKPADNTELEALTNVVSKRVNAKLEIDTTSEDGIAIINVSVNNVTISDDIEVRELGLFCKDPDTGAEVMYSYAYAPSSADVIPSASNGEMVWRIQLLVYIENATGSGSSQSDAVVFTPTVTATAADGRTVFLSDVVASAKYSKGGRVMTVFYNITGTLTNMEKAASGLTSVAITLPQSSAIECAATGRMEVIDSNDARILVDVTGVISEGGATIALDYLGSQDGDFKLLMTVQYIT